MPEIRIGQGFDLHRLEQGRPFKLGGILIDAPYGPVGHSDGDALLHAITDALLGASGLGDIGEWFSPSDPSFKNADSADLLTRVMNQLKTDNWTLLNADCTVLLEKPKLSAYKDAIRQRVAALLHCDSACIGIKAKTMEGLGSIGAEEAVAAMASVLLQRS